MRKRDSLYDKYKKYRRPADRHAHLELKHSVNKKLKEAHNIYIEEILGITNSVDPNDSNANSQTDTDPHKNTFATKKLYSLEKLQVDSKDSAPLTQNGQLYTNTTDKASILNQQFKLVFTPKTPLMLSKLSRMAVQDLVDDGKLHPSQIPSETLSTVPQMSNITISLNGILKLLKDLNPHKAAGPDQLKPLVLQRLSDIIAPICRSYSNNLLTLVGSPKNVTLLMSALFSKKEILALHLITGQYHWLASYVIC